MEQYTLSYKNSTLSMKSTNTLERISRGYLELNSNFKKLKPKKINFIGSYEHLVDKSFFPQEYP